MSVTSGMDVTSGPFNLGNH